MTARKHSKWKVFEHHWEQYTMMSATLPWLRFAQGRCRGGLASPGYKMISLGYKFQAETPAARSPPPLPSCYNPSLCELSDPPGSLPRPDSLSLSPFLSFPSRLLRSLSVLLHSFSFVFHPFPSIYSIPSFSRSLSPAQAPRPRKLACHAGKYICHSASTE